MTRGSIFELIEKLGLYSNLPLTPNEKVNLFRRSVGIDVVAAARTGYSDDGAISVLTVSAEMSSPELAQAVAREISQRIIELSVDSRILQARETLKFFAERERVLRTELAALEDRIVDFRNTHDVSLPGSVESRRAEIDAINQTLLEIDRETIAIERQAEREIRTARDATAQRLRQDYDDELAILTEQRSLLENRRHDLMASIETTPEIERELNVLTRERDDVQRQLDMVMARQSEAEVGFGLESEQQAERLTVIEPAGLPDYPTGGSRKKVAAMGGVASLGLALLIAFLLDLRRPVIRSAVQMERETGLEPVISIPHLETEPRQRGWFWRRTS
ncbi:GumC domain-containing protein [Pontibaca salina]